MHSLLDRYPGVYHLWRTLRLSRGGRALARARERRVTPARLARHAAAARTPDPSYASEWAHLRALVERLGVAEPGFAVDLAAGDGVTSSCTLPLFRDLGWRGLAIECDPARFTLLAHAYRDFAGVRLGHRRVTPDDAVAVLTEYGVPREFTVLNLDVDSYDLSVAGAILAAFRPLVVDLEINEKVPPPVRFAVRYTPDFRWDEGHCYGCSLAAAHDVLSAAGYRLEGVEYNNAFFVRADVAERRGIPAIDPETAYREGYAERAERRRLFPWNRDVDHLLGCTPEQVVVRLERRFRAARASYALQTEPLAPGWDTAPGGEP